MTFISTWDSGQPNAYWDVGLDWDTNVGPSLGDVQAYLNLVPSPNNQQPDYMAMLGGVLQPLADIIAVLQSMPAAYDLDAAVGAQLDVVGQWVGATRNISVPLTGVFFSWNTAGLGWNQGNWTFPPLTELSVLDDANYLTLLMATIAANGWDGTIPGAYAAWDALFAGTGIGILIQDYQDMTMAYALTGPVPSAVTLALFTGGYLNLKPGGVAVRAYYTPALPDTPYFAWGVTNDNLAGWGAGAWGVLTPGS